jgi:hypothetical protein
MTTRPLNTSWPSIYKTFWNQKIIKLISKDFPQMWKFVKEFIHTCNMCAWTKAPHHQSYGFLQPLPILKCPFISMDFIIDLPCSKSFNYSLVLVYLFIKMMYFVPITKIVTSEHILKLLYKYHGLPLDIV